MATRVTEVFRWDGETDRKADAASAAVESWMNERRRIGWETSVRGG